MKNRAITATYHRLARLLVVVGVLFGLLACASVFMSTSLRAQRPAATGPLMVRGYIVARIGGDRDAPVLAAVKLPVRDVYLPGVDAFLGDERGNAVGRSVRTDLSGRFSLYAERPGSYRVCWKADGFAPGCDPRPAVLERLPVFLGKVPIRAQQRRDHVVVFGEVRMADGTLPRMLQPLANVNSFATVTLSDANRRPMHKTWVNNFGEYLVPQVPIKTNVHLRAEVEKGEIEQPILPQSELQRAPVHRYDLRIANTPPRLDPLVPLDAATGRRLEVAAPGAEIALKAAANDPDGDALEYVWELPAGAGALSATSGPNVSWKLPQSPGQYTVAVTAWDRKGGYARMPLLVRADAAGEVAFSGIVRDNVGAVVANADVEINGDRARTDASGLFHLPVKPSDRYVFNIRKPSYAFYSKIYDRGMAGGVWTITRAFVMTVDPTEKIEVVQRRGRNDCPGPASARLDWRSHPRSMVPQWQDGKGNVIHPAARERDDKRQNLPVLPWERKGGECGPGISVSIPADALVDRNGRAPTGNVQLSLATVDLMSPEQMPGDYTVVVPNGDTHVMQSFGAGLVEVTAGGGRLNLKPGAEAVVTIPVDPSQLAAGGPLPPAIPILFYDEVKGVWLPEGHATLTGTGSNRAYVAKVTHFSAINADTLKTDQACVRVLSPAMPSTYYLEVTVPQLNGNAPKVFTQLMNNASPSEHVIYNLPINSTIMLVPTPASGSNTTPFGVFIVNTGQQQNPTSPNKPAGPPYTACATQVTLVQQTFPAAPVSGEFLHGLFSFHGTNLDELDANDPVQGPLKSNLEAASQAYKSQIDLAGKRPTLTKFREVNGFIDAIGNPLADVVNAKYANSGDLGFGRDMYCKKQQADDSQFDYACYVSNYGDVNTVDLQDAIDAAAGGPPVATVAMEYSRLEDAQGVPDGPERTVKFYVFDTNGNPLYAANLDGVGARPVPQLCMVCHGGVLAGQAGAAVPQFNSPAAVRLGSRFVPFDLRYFTFPPAPNDKANPAVQTAFQQLNDIVAGVAADVGATAITDVITEMYPGGATPQIENFTVAGWRAPAAPEPAKAAFYKGMVSNACRMCHIAQPAANPINSNDLRFNTAAGFLNVLSAVGGRVCTEQVMPHARRTHDIFWAITDPTVTVPSVVPHMASALQVFGSQFGPAGDWIGLGGNPPTYQCGTSFQSGGTTPLSFYQQFIQPLFEANHNRCTNCHGGAGGLSLSSGVSYGNLVNQPAGELGSMNLVTPFSSANSYMFHKIEGDQSNVGGSGSQMPADCNPNQPNANPPCVNATDQGTIQNWIDVRGADGP